MLTDILVGFPPFWAAPALGVMLEGGESRCRNVPVCEMGAGKDPAPKWLCPPRLLPLQGPGMLS